MQIQTDLEVHSKIPEPSESKQVLDVFIFQYTRSSVLCRPQDGIVRHTKEHMKMEI